MDFDFIKIVDVRLDITFNTTTDSMCREIFIESFIRHGIQWCQDRWESGVIQRSPNLKDLLIDFLKIEKNTSIITFFISNEPYPDYSSKLLMKYKPPLEGMY